MANENPAAKLRDVFAAVRNQPPTLQAFQAWASAMGYTTVAGPDMIRALRGLADVAGLAAETRRRMRDLPSNLDPAILAPGFDQIENVVARFPQTGTVTVQQLLVGVSEIGWQSLNSLALLLQTPETVSDPPPQIVLDLIERVRAAVDALVQDKTLAGDLREILIARLRSVEEAALAVRGSGIARLQETSDALMGSLSRSPSRMKAVLLSPVATQIVAVLGLLTSMTGTALTAIDSADGTRPQEPVVMQFYEQVRPQPSSPARLPAGHLGIAEPERGTQQLEPPSSEGPTQQPPR